MDHLKETLGKIDAFPGEELPLSVVGPLIAMLPSTLAGQIKIDKIEAVLKNRRYFITKEHARTLVRTNLSKILGWERLVDICKQVGIHRNIGESICRKYDLPCEIDLCGHMRIPPEARERIEAEMQGKRDKKHWVRKVDFAESLNEHPTLVDTVCRKATEEIDLDVHGFVILSPTAQQAFLDWRARRDSRKKAVLEVGGQRYYSLLKTAKDSAAFFVSPSNRATFNKITETYQKRFNYWIRTGLEFRSIDDKRYFHEDVYRQLVDDLTITEAARCGGVAASTIKSWVANGSLSARRTIARRKSLSKEEFVRVLGEKFEHSPVLRSRNEVPVKVLSEIQDLVTSLAFRGPEALLGCLKEVTGISRDALQPLALGSGTVPRVVKDLLDDWTAQIDAGRQPSQIPKDFRGVDAERVRNLTTSLLEGKWSGRRPELENLLSLGTGLGQQVVRSLVSGGQSDPYYSIEVAELLEFMHKTEPLPYLPEKPYEIGDVLIHPHGGDFGVVTEKASDRQISVCWRKLGPATMACGVMRELVAN
ncbi:MAG: hypothetical protein AAF514_00465 [Verrucomicrobiota bacterium]